MADARISTTLPSHPKTKKLMRSMGHAGAWYLVRLFLWVAENRSTGDLSGLADDDIELAIDFDGESGAFMAALSEVGLIDGEAGSRSIHDWVEHNPWAAGADARSVKAKWNAMKRHHGEAAADRMYPDYAATRTAGRNASSTTPAQEQHANSNAPSPSPSPIPYPSPIPVCDGAAPPPPHKQASWLDGVPTQPEKPKREKKAKEPAPTAEVWKAYSEAYQRRYSVEPVRNAAVNGQLAQFVARIGAEEAPAVAAFFVGSSNHFYASKAHAVGMMLADAEKLRMEWKTGRGSGRKLPAPENFSSRNYGDDVEYL